MMLYKSTSKGTLINIEDLFVDSMKFLIFLLALFSIAALAYSSANAPAGAIASLYLLLIPAALSFMLTRIPLRLWLMFSCQGALTVSPIVMLLFRPYYESFFSILLMLIIVMVSLSKRYRRNEKSSVSFEIIGANVTIHILLLVLCTQYSSGNTPYVILAHTLISICLFFAARQHYTFETGYGHISNSPTQPSGSVKKMNALVILALFFFMIVVIPLIVFFPYSILIEILKTVLNWIFIVIAAIYSLLRRLQFLPIGSEEDPLPKKPEETSDTAEMNKYVQYAILIIAFAVFLLLLFYAVKKIMHFIFSRYRRALPGGNALPTELVHDEIISLEKKKVKRYRKNDFGKGKEKEVRKQYFRSVKKEIRSGAAITVSQSPGEIIQAIKKSSGNDLTELTSTYELFRYGNGSDDVNPRSN